MPLKQSIDASGAPQGEIDEQPDARQGAQGDAVVEDFVMVEVGEDGQPLAQQTDKRALQRQQPEAGDEPDPEEEDERLGHSEEDADDQGLRSGETEDEATERRRRENRARRIRNKRLGEVKDRQIESLVQANQDLHDRVAAMEGRTVQYDVNIIKTKISDIDQQLEAAKDTMASCVKAADGEGVAECTEIQFSLREQKRQLNTILQRAEQQQHQRQDGQPQSRQQGGRPPQQRVDPKVQELSAVWNARVPWYKPDGKSEDEFIVRGIDQAIFAEGFRPNTQEYWDELHDRVKKRLPHRFQSRAGERQVESQNGGRNGSQQSNGDGQRRQQQGGPRMAAPSQNGQRRALGKNEVYVTPERRAAMQAAGKWDDPIARARLLKAYADHDKANPRS